MLVRNPPTHERGLFPLGKTKREKARASCSLVSALKYYQKLLTGYDPTRGSGQKVSKVSRVGLGRVKRSSKPPAPDRVGSGWVARPDP